MYIQHISQIWIRFDQYIPCLRVIFCVIRFHILVQNIRLLVHIYTH